MGILTPAQFREHVQTQVVDDALQRLLDAAESTILSRFGTLGAHTERRRGGATFLFLARTASAVSSVTERYGDPLGVTDVLLASNDYTLLADGRTLRREYTGTHPSDRWTDDVIVAYTVLDDLAERQRVSIELVKLDLASQPGLSGQSIGSWAEEYRNVDYSLTRKQILDSMASDAAWFA